ncbi:SPFH domain-containing protein [Lutibacter maritimus]|uniref:SPFH domain / Band 7 family protein n=1 Tax=Lutibacter maritimus TaxID=593133 RepID=A0A1I6SU06_9FLAO|nr:SPFH domain-containing protein [Lutibacter maritimus]SFS80414.1 SPFH domain / Band 7 family protein [Lutibacter maritimus]
MTQEKIIKLSNGYFMLFVLVLLIAGGICGLVYSILGLFIALLILTIITIPGFFLVNPNTSKVLLLFGKYIGTVKENGFYWANPLYTKKSISLRASNFDSERVKVNDKLGNPIMISTIAVWKVKDTYKAAFDVDNYENFVRVQSDAAVRKLASLYPYDNFEDDGKAEEITLRASVNEVSEALELELSERLEMAGIEVLEARIGYLAYAQEIASAMLKRQQATAIIAARHKIVEGAVGMVEMALHKLSKDNIVDLDEERKAAMVSNLMVVLCSDKDVAPIVNTGTLNH